MQHTVSRRKLFRTTAAAGLAGLVAEFQAWVWGQTPCFAKALRCLFSAALLLAPCAMQQPARAETTWQAGAAKININPTEPVWLAGYGGRERPVSKVIHDIHAKAVALKDQTGQTSVLVTADLLGFTARMAKTIRERAKQKYGLARDRIAFNASHTHSAPVTGNMLRPAYLMKPKDEPPVQRYTAKIIDQAVELIGQAIDDLAPAELSFEQSLAGFAVNRRRARSGKRHYPSPVDHDVPVLVVKTVDGKIKAIVFGYACHATVLSGYEINGDWPGYAQEKAYPGAIALFVAGCGADANPLPRRSVDLAQRYGETLAFAVGQVVDGKRKPVRGPLKTAFEHVPIAFQSPPTREELEGRLKTETGSRKRHAQFLLDKLNRDGKLPTEYPYPLQVWQFGDDLTFIHMAGEVVVDYSLRFKGAYGWENTWVAGYSNDVFAYIPSVRILKEGGYEGGGAMIGYGQPRPFTAAVEQVIADKVDELVKRTQGMP